MKAAAGLLDRRAVDPHLASDALERLGDRCRAAGTATTAVVAACLLLGLAGSPAAVLPLAAGAFTGVVLWLRVHSRRRALVRQLVCQRSAYVIAEVELAGRRQATPAARAVLAATLERLVAMSREGPVPVSYVLLERVRSHADELLDVARLLRLAVLPVHPSSVALLRLVLSWPARSPLYNPDVPEAELGIVLRRIRLELEGVW